MSLVEVAMIMSVLAILGTLIFVSFRPILASAGDEQARLSVATVAALIRADAEFAGMFDDPLLLQTVAPLEVTDRESTDPLVVSVFRVSDAEVLYAALGYPGRCWVHVDRLPGAQAPGWALLRDVECDASQLVASAGLATATLDEVADQD
jgi:hypothetical protein